MKVTLKSPKKRQRRKLVRTGSFHVYILSCSDGTYYTGYTPDLERRVKLHNDGKGAKYTKPRRPVVLAWCRKFRYFKHAVRAECALKKLTRAEKIKLVAAYESGNRRVPA